MPYTFISMDFVSGDLLGELPLEISGSANRVLKEYGSAEFTLDVTDKMTPDNHDEMTAPRKVIILMVDEDYNIVWAGMPNDDARSSSSTFKKIPCVTLEAHFNNIMCGNAEYRDADMVSEIALGLAKMAGDNANFEYDCPPSGQLRTEIYITEEDVLVLDRLKALANTIEGFEFSVDVEWTDDSYTKIRKIFRAKHRRLGNITATPDHVFEMPGNITSFEFSQPRVNGAYATRVQSTGDGEGIHKVRSTELVDTWAEKPVDQGGGGYARFDYRKNFPGVTDSVTINKINQALYNMLTSGQNLITLTVRADGPTKLSDLKLGDTALIDIDTPQLQLQEVWRVVGFELTPSSDQYMPVLAKMAEDATDFILRQTPIDLIKTVIDDVNKYQSQDNLAPGYTWTAADGSKFTLGSGFDAGIYDSLGNFMPLFDGAGGFGSAFGGGGNGGSASGFNVDNGTYIMESNDSVGSGSPSIDFYPYTAQTTAGEKVVSKGPGGKINLYPEGDASDTRTMRLTGPGVDFQSDPELQVGNHKWLHGPTTRVLASEPADGTLRTVASLTAQDMRLDGGAGNSVLEIEFGEVFIDGTTHLDRAKAESLDVHSFISTAGIQILPNPTSPSYISALESDNLHVRGDLTVAGSKQFRMDHPDGSDRYLIHAATESDVNGVEYWGERRTNDDGIAVVVLADWFEKLVKKEHRAVFLEAIDSFTAKTASRIVDGKFTIRTAEPNVDVCWTVKAERVVLVDGIDTIAFDPERDH